MASSLMVKLHCCSFLGLLLLERGGMRGAITRRSPLAPAIIVPTTSIFCLTFPHNRLGLLSSTIYI